MYEQRDAYDILLNNILPQPVRLYFLVEIPMILRKKIAFSALCTHEFYNDKPVDIFWAVKQQRHFQPCISEPFPLKIPVRLPLQDFFVAEIPYFKLFNFLI